MANNTPAARVREWLYPAARFLEVGRQAYPWLPWNTCEDSTLHECVRSQARCTSTHARCFHFDSCMSSSLGKSCIQSLSRFVRVDGEPLRCGRQHPSLRVDEIVSRACGEQARSLVAEGALARGLDGWTSLGYCRAVGGHRSASCLSCIWRTASSSLLLHTCPGTFLHRKLPTH